MGTNSLSETIMPPPVLPFGQDALERTARLLRHGGVVILPTETVYGLACHPDFPDALERIRALKDRDRDKPFQLLAADTATVRADGALWSSEAERFAAAYWPGPLTLVLPTNKGRTEGYRVPALPLLRRLLLICGGLLRCTSVNLSGHPPARDVTTALGSIGQKVDLVLDGGPAMLGVASTVVAISPEGVPTILRQGSARIS